MKLSFIFCIIIFIIIDGVQNVPTIRPKTVHTIPLHSITVNPTPTRVPPITPGRSSKTYSSAITHFTRLTSSSSLASTTTQDSSWRNDSNDVLYFCLRVFAYLLLAAIVGKVLSKVCSSTKPAKPIKQPCPGVIENKMYISTISGQREESPPAYAEIHKV